jgi:glycosyltransferase involved in cell wall biosynthesis
MNDMKSVKLVSVVIPVGARAAALHELYADYKQGLDALELPYEVVFVVDGPRRVALAQIEQLADAGEPVVTLKLTRAFGEATALAAAFERVSGDIVLTLPAYHQIAGSDIEKLLIGLEGGADMVVGRRWPRAGGKLETWRRDAFHRMVGAFTGAKFRDLGCCARAMRRRVIAELTPYGDQHRFLPLLAERQGFRVVEIDVAQSPLDRRANRYPLKEYAHRALDILTVLFLVRFTKKPLRFFGMLGVVTFALGALLITYMVVERLFFGQGLSDRPALLLASLLVVLGLQLFAIGLLGELVIFTHAKDIKDYKVDEIIEFTAAADGAQSDAAASKRRGAGEADAQADAAAARAARREPAPSPGTRVARVAG